MDFSIIFTAEKLYKTTIIPHDRVSRFGKVSLTCNKVLRKNYTNWYLRVEPVATEIYWTQPIIDGKSWKFFCIRLNFPAVIVNKNFDAATDTR